MSIEPGKDTSEFAVQKSASLWGIIGMVLGFVTTTGATIAESFGVDTKAGIIAGMVIMVSSALLKGLTSLGYIKSRTDVKKAEEK